MKLLGSRNWYLPRWLEWLPRLETREPEVAVAPEPAAASVAETEREPVGAGR
jgi:putative drug exporter of the RND superfamily